MDPEELPISRDLKARLLLWVHRYDSTLNPHDPASSGFPDLDSVDDFAEEGKRLLDDLEDQLGDDYEITYVDLRQLGIAERSDVKQPV